MSDMANDTASEQPAPAGAALEAETLFTPLAEGAAPSSDPAPSEATEDSTSASPRKRRRRGSRGGRRRRPAGAQTAGETPAAPAAAGRRRGRERKGRPVGRYLMCVHVRPHATQIAVLEGRALIEHYVSRPEDDAAQIDGNVYLGRVQNVLPGMEAAFVDIGTPK